MVNANEAIYAVVRFSSPAASSVTVTKTTNLKESLLRNPFLITWLFSVYAFRHLRNSGNHPSKQSILFSLSNWRPLFGKDAKLPTTEEKVLAALHMPLLGEALGFGMDPDRAKKKYGEQVFIISDSHDGKKEFSARLENPFTKPSFFMDINGFGFSGLFGVDMPMYSPNSVVIFLTYLALSFRQTEGYIDRLFAIADTCAQAFKAGKVTILNQEALGFDIVRSSGLEWKM